MNISPNEKARLQLRWFEQWIKRLQCDLDIIRPRPINIDQARAYDEIHADLEKALGHIEDALIQLEPE